MAMVFKVIRHVFDFGIEFFENKDTGIFGHFIVIDFIKRYSYHTYLSPISTSRFRRFGTCCIVPVIIERTIGLVLGPCTALYRPFLKHCTLTNKAVGTI